MNQWGPELHIAQVQTSIFVSDLMIAKEWGQLRLAMMFDMLVLCCQGWVFWAKSALCTVNRRKG